MKKDVVLILMAACTLGYSQTEKTDPQSNSNPPKEEVDQITLPKMDPPQEFDSFGDGNWVEFNRDGED